VQALSDGAIVIVIVFPLLYFLSLRPFLEYINHYRQARMVVME